MITSVQNPKVKRIRHLQTQSRFRKKESAYVVEGIRLVEDMLAANQTPEIVIYTPDLDQRGNQLIKQIHERKIPVEEVSWEVFKSTSQTKSPQGILAVLPILELPVPDRLDFVLITDEIRDPGNLGTLLRTALAAGVQLVLLSPGTVDPHSPKVVRSGMGAHFSLPILICSWEDIRRLTQDIRVYGSDMNRGSILWEEDLTNPLGFIIGGEAEGPGNQAQKLAQDWVKIPMDGNIESLNAAAAGAVLLFEVLRQRSNLAQ